MIFARNLVWMIGVVIVQATYGEKLTLFGIRPDLVLLTLAYVALSGGQIEGTVLGFFAGFLQDVYAPEYFGLNAFAKSVVGFAVGYGRGSVVIEHVGTRGLILFGAAFGHDLLYFLLRGDWVYVLRIGLPTAFYTALLGVGISILYFKATGRKIRGYAKRPF
ncbi:MAG: rod shape-determining protein MreD [Candidatus Latescibacterota bacterium]